MKQVLHTAKFEVRFVESGKLLEKAKRLRHKVFFKKDGLDEDQFDPFCTHTVVIEKNTEKVIGTYRLLLGSNALRNRGFYSETEFNLEKIKKNCRGELLEMGRACVDSFYRGAPIINLLWRSIISFVDEHHVKYIFGCSSIDNPDPKNIGKIFKFFKANAFSPEEFRVFPLAGKEYPYQREVEFPSTRELIDLIPSLVRGYLKIGAFSCGAPVWDKEFDTADFFMLINTAKLNSLYRDKFS